MSDLLLPLPQSPEYARACAALGVDVRACQRQLQGQATLRWQTQSRRLGLLGRVDLISRGPVAENPMLLRSWLARWQNWHDGRPLLLNAAGMDAADLRKAGFWPLMTPASLALLPLSDAATMRAALHQKWRNRLNRAEAAGLTIRYRPLEAHHWVLKAETAQARARGYRALPPAFSLAFAQANPGKALVCEAKCKGAPVAAIVILRHGHMATWQIGHTKPEGRKTHAMNLLLWRAMTELSEQGHRMLDLGTVNTDDAPGIAHFKRGTGARIDRQSGSWLHLGALAPLARRLPARLAA